MSMLNKLHTIGANTIIVISFCSYMATSLVTHTGILMLNNIENNTATLDIINHKQDILVGATLWASLHLISYFWYLVTINAMVGRAIKNRLSAENGTWTNLACYAWATELYRFNWITIQEGWKLLDTVHILALVTAFFFILLKK
jgi:hypothetical protein